MRDAGERHQEKTLKLRAAQRLLAWGFSPALIADNLHCSLSSVYRIRRTLQPEDVTPGASHRGQMG
ncbi:MAG TPA: helix-turn-helix domain-containing protein [Chloroflexota bacterium]